MRARSPLSLSFYAGVTIAVLILVAVLPVGYGIIESLISGQDGEGPLLSSRHGVLLRNSLLVSLGTTAMAMCMGLGLSLAAQVSNKYLRWAFYYGATVSFLLPAHLLVLAWIEVAGNRGMLHNALSSIFGDGLEAITIYSIPGVVWVLSLALYPLIVGALCVSFSLIDRGPIEAAQLVASPWRRLIYIVLPQLFPALVTGATLVCLLSLVSFSVPSMLQVRVFPVEIHSEFSAFRDSRSAYFLGGVLTFSGTLVLAVWYILLRGKHNAWGGSEPLAVRRGKRDTAARTLSDMGTASKVAVIITGCAIVTLSALLPLLVLLRRSLPLSTYQAAWSTAWDEFSGSALLGATGATVIVALGFSMAFLAHRIPRLNAVFMLSALPFLISGPALGIGLILLWNHSGMRGWVYDSSVILVFAVVARFTIFAFAGLSVAFATLNRGLEEAAETAGVPWWRQLRGIHLPLLAPWLIAAWGLAFLLCAGEVDSTVLVAPPGFTTLSMRIYGLMHYGPSALVAALSVIMTGAILLAAALIFCSIAVAQRFRDALES